MKKAEMEKVVVGKAARSRKRKMARLRARVNRMGKATPVIEMILSVLVVAALVVSMRSF